MRVHCVRSKGRAFASPIVTGLMKLAMLEDEQRDVVMNLLGIDVIHHVANNTLLDFSCSPRAMGTSAFAEARDPKKPTLRAFGLGDPVCVENHEVARLKANRAALNKLRDLRLQANWEAKINGVDPLHFTVFPNDNHLFMLAGKGDRIVGVVDE